MNPSDSVAPARPTVFTIILVGVGVVALLAVLGLVLFSSDNSVTWLAPGTPLQRPLLPPGPLQRLKARLMNFADPLLQRFRTARSVVIIDAQVISVPGGNLAALEKRPAPTTNGNGVCAWVLPGEEWKALVQQLKAMPQAEAPAPQRLHTVERMQAQIAVTGSVVAGGQPVAVGTELRVFTQAGRRGVRLALDAEITEQVQQFSARARATPTAGTVIRTNLSVTLQAAVPEGSALVLARETTNATAGSTLWLIVSPTQPELKGKPGKP